MRCSMLGLMLLLPSCGAQKPESDLKREMRGHYYDGVVIRAAIIRGDLTEARLAAERLASTPVTSNETNARHAERVQAAARTIATADRITAAALGLGEVATGCGACHEASGVVLVSPPDPWPDVRPDVEGHMLRHQWAAERMWDALIRPSDEAWLTGVDALYEKPLPTQELPLRRIDLRDATHAITTRGPTAAKADRGELYGAFLSTCALCHKSERRENKVF